MSERDEAGRADPLPPAWLPEPSAPAEGDPGREALARRIVRAAGPRLEQLAAESPAQPRRPAPWWADLGAWLRPAAGLAAAVAVLLLATEPWRGPADMDRSSPTLAALVTDGDPAALWRAAGTDAHPVLALIALEETP